jgi:hypothetical protein
MKDYELYKQQAKQAFEKISKQLNAKRINDLFEEPIKTTLCDFSYVLPKVPDTDALLDITVDFLKDCYSTGLKVNFPITYWHYKAVYFLEKFYQGVHFNGLEAAMDDAFNYESGSVELFLNNLGASLYHALVADYRRFVYKASIPCNWHIKYFLAQLVVDRYERFLPEEIVEAPNWSLISLLPELLDLCLQTEQTFENTFRAAKF